MKDYIKKGLTYIIFCQAVLVFLDGFGYSLLNVGLERQMEIIKRADFAMLAMAIIIYLEHRKSKNKGH